MATLTSNIFQKHHLDECCSGDDLRPFINYVYFIAGIAYASDGYVLIAASLTDLNADEELIAALNDHKIHKDDFKILKQDHWLYVEEDGSIKLNSSGTFQLHLRTLNYNDEKENYKLIFDKIEQAKNDLRIQKVSLSKIKISLFLLEKVSKAFGYLASARFKWLQKPDRVYLEFDAFKNSFAIVMPMFDESDTGINQTDATMTKQSGTEYQLHEPTIFSESKKFTK